MMRTSKRVRTLWLGMALCAAVPFAGCGHREAGPLSEGGENSPATPGTKPAEASLEQQTEQKLDPLTKDDVELYLKVMRAAPGRVNNPASADRAALEGATKILAGSASGRVPTQDDVKTLERADLAGKGVQPGTDHVPTPLEERLSGLNTANEKFLAPYRGEIQKLLPVVRNPANLPK